MTQKKATVSRNRLSTRLALWARKAALARRLAIGLTVAAIASGVATYIALTGSPLGPDPTTILILIIVDLCLLLPLAALVAYRVVRLWAEHRRGMAGARLHTRLVLLFSALAAAPAIIVVVFSAFFFNFGIQSWFSDRVGTALRQSLSITDKYLEEQNNDLTRRMTALADDIDRQSVEFMVNPSGFASYVTSRAEDRGLGIVYVLDDKGRILVRTSNQRIKGLDPKADLERAKKLTASKKVVTLATLGQNHLRGITKLTIYFNSEIYLYATKEIEPALIAHISRLRHAVDEYVRLESQRSSVQISFFLLFALVSLLLLLAAIWLGLFFANRLVRPIGALIDAAERVRAGDLKVRVAEAGDDELANLSRAFNRMTGQLAHNQQELVEANMQIDARRKFTETVLAGVSAGVVGLDADGRINLPNRSASELLMTELDDRIGAPLIQVVPEMTPMLAKVRRRPYRLESGEIQLVRDGRTLTLLVRIAAERIAGKIVGYVVTFDDITELQSAQRKAAWADVARRIAHEIKNPLTPIQLSAERLRRRYLKQIEDDPETFTACTDTIIRQVGDIGRLVDEFSAFARMPAPNLQPHNLHDICRNAVFLQRTAHPAIVFELKLDGDRTVVRCDDRQIGQALTNLLQNAAQSIEERPEDSSGPSTPEKGLIEMTVSRGQKITTVTVSDNGKGLPADLLHKLTEPYVTTRSRGTGLGLAIVRKIMEDHGGALRLENRMEGGARITLEFPSEGAGAGSEPVADAAAE